MDRCLKKIKFIRIVLLAIPVAALFASSYNASAQELTPFDWSVFIAKQGRGRAQQGMEIYRNYIFSLEDGGNVNIYDFRKADGKVIASFPLASSRPDNHANNAEFGVEKKRGASFPLMYITNGKVGSDIEWICFVESISVKDGVWTSEIVQTIVLDGCKGWKDAGYTPIFGAPSWLVDRERGDLWVFSAIKRTVPAVTKHNWENLYVATRFRIPRLAEGKEVVLTVKDIKGQVTFPYDVGFTQAGCVRDGKIYYAFGVGKDPSRPASIRVYDTDSGEIYARYDMLDQILQEPEDIVVKGKWIYLNANTNAKKGEIPNIYRISRPGALASCRAWTPLEAPRDFLSHRGVHLGSTLCGENSLEAVDFAKRAGFAAIETDCRYTKDSVLVIIHDAAINRTFVNADGSKIKGGKVMVQDLRFDEFRTKYRLKAGRPEFRRPVPTLREYLRHCRDLGFPVYIEPKLNDTSGRYYLDIIAIADEEMGRGNYVICSNNFANGVIRNTLGIKDIPLMGLLYQTDWDTMDALGNTRFALSSTAFDSGTFHNYTARTVKEGKPNESACGLRSQDDMTKLRSFNKVFAEGNNIGLVASDLNVPDYRGQGRTVAEFSVRRAEKLVGKLAGLPAAELYGIYVELQYEGSAVFEVGPDKFTVGREQGGRLAYQRMVYNSTPHIAIKGADAFKLKKCKVRIVEL